MLPFLNAAANSTPTEDYGLGSVKERSDEENAKKNDDDEDDDDVVVAKKSHQVYDLDDEGNLVPRIANDGPKNGGGGSTATTAESTNPESLSEKPAAKRKDDDDDGDNNNNKRAIDIYHNSPFDDGLDEDEAFMEQMYAEDERNNPDSTISKPLTRSEERARLLEMMALSSEDRLAGNSVRGEESELDVNEITTDEDERNKRGGGLFGNHYKDHEGDGPTTKKKKRHNKVLDAFDQYKDKTRRYCGPCVWEYRLVVLISLLGSLIIIVGLATTLRRLRNNNEATRERIRHNGTSDDDVVTGDVMNGNGSSTMLPTLPPSALRPLVSAHDRYCRDDNDGDDDEYPYDLLACFPPSDSLMRVDRFAKDDGSDDGSNDATVVTVTGVSTTVSEHGTVFAVGVRRRVREDDAVVANDGDRRQRRRPIGGSVRVYHYVANFEERWTTYDLEDRLPDDRNVRSDPTFGTSVSISGDGDTLAVGAPSRYPETGRTVVYERIESRDPYDNSFLAFQWERTVVDVAGGLSASGDREGHAVVLSRDGAWLAVGAPGAARDGGPDRGRVRLWRRTRDGKWARGGDDDLLLGPGSGDQYGSSVSLSDDGSVLAVGSWSERGTGARVFAHRRSYDGTAFSWSANTITSNVDDATTSLRGKGRGTGHAAVRLSADGELLAVALGPTEDDDDDSPIHESRSMVWRWHGPGETWHPDGTTLVTTTAPDVTRQSSVPGGLRGDASSSSTSSSSVSRVAIVPPSNPAVDLSGDGSRVLFLTDGVLRDYAWDDDDENWVLASSEPNHHPNGTRNYDDDDVAISSRPGAASLSRDGARLVVASVVVVSPASETRNGLTTTVVAVVPRLYNATTTSA